MSLPSMNEAFSGWMTYISLRVVRSTVSDFEPVDTELLDKQFKAVMQPVPPQRLLVKPEGQRTWRWWTMWTRQNLNVGASVSDQHGVLFRVMSKSDWSAASVIEYELAEAPAS